MDDGELLNRAPLKSIDDDTLALDLNVSEERLPHIPLRPFRNQVGGHSAIYKFTKQAVCKVRRNIMFKSLFADMCTAYFRCILAACVKRKFILRVG